MRPCVHSTFQDFTQSRISRKAGERRAKLASCIHADTTLPTSTPLCSIFTGTPTMVGVISRMSASVRYSPS